MFIPTKIAVFNFMVVVFCESNYFVGYDIEIAPVDHDYSKSSPLMTSSLLQSFNSCVTCVSVRKVSIVYISEFYLLVKSGRDTSSNEKNNQYSLHYCDIETEAVLNEQPYAFHEVQQLSHWVKISRNIIESTAGFSGTVEIRALSAIIPVRMSLKFTGGIDHWTRIPEYDEVAYNINENVSQRGLVVRYMNQRPDSCYDVESRVKLVLDGAALRPDSTQLVHFLTIYCQINYTGRLLYHVFTMQFTLFRGFYYEPPFPAFIDLHQTRPYIHPLKHLSGNCTFNGELMAGKRQSIRGPGRFEIACNGSLVQIIHALVPTHGSLFNVFIANQTYSRITGDQIVQIGLQYGGYRLYDHKFIDCDGLRFKYPTVVLNKSIHLATVLPMVCYIPATERWFRKVIYLKRRYKIAPVKLETIPTSSALLLLGAKSEPNGSYPLIVPYRTVACYESVLQLLCLDPDSGLPRKKKLFWRITQGEFSKSGQLSAIHYLVQPSAANITVTCHINSSAPPYVIHTIQTLNTSEVEIHLRPQEWYYFEGFEHELSVYTTPKAIEEDEFYKASITLNKTLRPCDPATPVSSGHLYENVMCVKVSVQIILEDCDEFKKSFYLRVIANFTLLEISPNNETFIYVGARPISLATCRIPSREQFLGKLVKVNWILLSSIQPFFTVTQGNWLTTVPGIPSGRYCFTCESSGLIKRSIERCLTIMDRLHFHSHIQSNSTQMYVDISEHVRWICQPIFSQSLHNFTDKLVTKFGATEIPLSNFRVTPDEVVKFGPSAEGVIFLQCVITFHDKLITRKSKRILVIDKQNLKLEITEQSVFNISRSIPLTCRWNNLIIQRSLAHYPVISQYTFDGFLQQRGHKLILGKSGKFSIKCEATLEDLSFTVVKNITVLPAPLLRLVVEPQVSAVPVEELVPVFTCRVDGDEVIKQYSPKWSLINPAADALQHGSDLIHLHPGPSYSLPKPGHYTYICVLKTEFGHFSYLLPLVRYTRGLLMKLEPATRGFKHNFPYTCTSNAKPTSLVNMKARAASTDGVIVDYYYLLSMVSFSLAIYNSQPASVNCYASVTFLGQSLIQVNITVEGDVYESSILYFTPDKTQFQYGEFIECHTSDTLTEDSELILSLLTSPRYSTPAENLFGGLFFRDSMIGGSYLLMCAIRVGRVEVAALPKTVHLATSPTWLLLSTDKSELPATFDCISNGYPVERVDVEWEVVDGPSTFINILPDGKLKFSPENYFGVYNITCTYTGIYANEVFMLSTNFTVRIEGDSFDNCELLVAEALQLPTTVVVLVLLIWTLTFWMVIVLLTYILRSTNEDSTKMLDPLSLPANGLLHIELQEMDRDTMLMFLFSVALFDLWTRRTVATRRRLGSLSTVTTSEGHHFSLRSAANRISKMAPHFRISSFFAPTQSMGTVDAVA